MVVEYSLFMLYLEIEQSFRFVAHRFSGFEEVFQHMLQCGVGYFLASL